MAEPRIEALSVLSLRPGDTLIIRTDDDLTQRDVDQIKTLVKSQLTVDVPVIVAARGVEFSIARPEAAS